MIMKIIIGGKRKTKKNMVHMMDSIENDMRTSGVCKNAVGDRVD